MPQGKVVLGGLNQSGVIVFIILLFFCIPLCWIPWVVDSLKGVPEQSRLVVLLRYFVVTVFESKITVVVLRCLAVALLAVYIGWNLYWIGQRIVPPSLFLAITGLPCPTTGGTRALVRLAAGDVRESLRFNAMAIPLTAMFIATLFVAAIRWRLRRTFTVPTWFVPAWLGVLLIAWVLKLAGSPGYW